MKGRRGSGVVSSLNLVRGGNEGCYGQLHEAVGMYDRTYIGIVSKGK